MPPPCLSFRLNLCVGICVGICVGFVGWYRGRDIKPENVLMGPGGEPQLMDFGSVCPGAVAVRSRAEALLLMDQVGGLLPTNKLLEWMAKRALSSAIPCV